ncbi:ShlB/FhaC/HecB family hemolysin secretion/activation protein [Sphingomonas koreensis]|nr:ShlB/FhaC/HecB family hemolysin secretion/activation protein [Sphingomonas koreensis]
MTYRYNLLLIVACLASASAAHGQSQNSPLRIDPGIATKAVKEPAPAGPAREPTAIETPPPTASTPGLPRRIMAGAIRVEGGEDLPADQMMASIAPFIGHQLSAGDIEDLLTAVSGIARAQGYLFARSSIPQQTMTAGVLRIALDEGHLDEIRLEGFTNDAVAATLHPLTGHAPKRDEVERRLMLAGDLPGVTIGKVRYTTEAGKGVLVVPVTHARIDGSAAFDNRGLDALGPERGRLTVDLNGLFSDRDQVTFQGLATPVEPQELTALYGRYAIQPTNSGTQFAIYGTYGQTRSGGLWRDYDPRGESESIGVSVMQPLVRSATTSLWLTAEGDRISVDEWWNHALVRRDRITTVGASLNGYTPLAGGRLRAGAGVTQGLLALGATPHDYPLASRYDAGSDFTTARAWADWQGDIAGPFSARLTTTSQLSTNPLPAVEQLTIGGPYYGRGYNFSERTGDRGVLGSAELRAGLLNRRTGFIRWAQLYTFADAGEVANLETDFGTGDLYSAGAGARLYFAQHLNLELEAAFPINADRYDSGDKSPRLSFSLTSNF